MKNITVSALAVCALLACSQPTETQIASGSELTAEEARGIAKEAFIYGFPMVVNYKTHVSVRDRQGVPRIQGRIQRARLPGTGIYSRRQDRCDAQFRHAVLHVLG